MSRDQEYWNAKSMFVLGRILILLAYLPPEMRAIACRRAEVLAQVSTGFLLKDQNLSPFDDL